MKKLIETSYENGYTFLIKVDGDGQFKKEDVKKLLTCTKKMNMNLLFNRFWSQRYKNFDIPKKRFKSAT